MRSPQLTVGFTGGLACGKSTAAQQFANLGAAVIDADEVERTLLAQDANLRNHIIEHFGVQCLNLQQQLDRSRLRQLIFQHPAHRRWLEALIHPPVYQAIQTHLQQQVRDDQYAIVVLPLLFESPPPLKLDRILVIDTPLAQQIQRAKMRAAKTGDSIKVEQIHAILQTQLPQSEKTARADDIIQNDADLTRLHQQVAHYHQAYTAYLHQV